MSQETGIKVAEYEMKDDGTVVHNVKGKAIKLAEYDHDTGHLEFESRAIDEKYRVQIQRAVTEDVEGIESGHKIESYSIKGFGRDDIKPNEPAKPKATKLLGDKTPAVVDWYFRWRPLEAYVRYGVRLDKDKNPVTAHCRRAETRIEVKEATGQVGQYEVVTEAKEGMIATRGTHRTFLKNEVVGSEQDDEADSEE